MAHKLEDKPRTKDILIKEDLTFNSLFLPDRILQGLTASGFHRPSPVQVKAIPLGRCGLDLIVKAKSGTGKTLVFTVVALESVDVTTPSPQIIILAPTREIAVQIEDVTRLLGQFFEGLHVACFIGGLPIEDDVKKLKACHIAIGAPGRVKALVEKNILKTSAIRLFVLDEADKLMEESYQPDINYIFNHLPQQKQVLAVSATYPDELETFLGNYMHKPTFVTPDVDNSLLLGLRQFVTVVKEHHNIVKQIDIKTDELVCLLSKISFTQCIVFFNFQTRAETLSSMLKERGWNALYISGAQSQKERLNVIKSLKKFECRILLTTDLTARGIDASNVNLVINFEVPFKAVTYLHRMGRAGRYGSHGVCVTISSEGRELHSFQKILGQIGGSELSVPKVPTILDDMWKCDISDLEKIESVVVDDDVDDDSNSNIKKTIIDLKSVNQNFEKLNVDDENSTVSDDQNECMQSDESLEVRPYFHNKQGSGGVDNEELISAHDIYPWVATNDNVLAKPTGKSLLGNDFNVTNVDKRSVPCKLANNTKLTVSKNIALYNSAQLLTTNDLHLTDNFSESVGNYFNVLEEENKKREKEMEKFFQSYSCDDILKNIAKHTNAWSNATHEDVSLPVTSPIKKTIKENIFKIGFDWITKKSSVNWTEVVSDYCSTEEEEDEEEDVVYKDLTNVDNSEYIYPESGVVNNTEFLNSHNATASSSTWYNSSSQYDYYNIASFQELYDEWSRDLTDEAKNFSDASNANEWCENWLGKLSSVTNYVQQNIETHLKSQYQYATYFNK